MKKNKLFLLLLVLLAFGQTAWAQFSGGDGTANNPYQISTEADWIALCSNVNNSTSTYEGNFFKLMADITVEETFSTAPTKMVGISENVNFRGTFDGNGHTLTVNLDEYFEFAAPFAYTHGATIKNLITTGTIITTKQHAGGVVGRNGTGKLTLENVKSDVTINSTYNGSAEHGGLVGYAINVDLIGCVFAGSILGENSTGCGGLIGWKTGTTGSSANLTDCLFAPANMTVGNTNAYTFAGLPSDSMANFTNCYYTEPFGTEQGKQAYSITCANNDITLNFAGAATENEVSGITSYANNHGFLYNDGTGSTLIAGNGDNVSLKLTAPADYIINSATYTPAGGTATEMTFANGGYSFTMPDTNVVINADVTVCGKILVDEDNPEWSEDFEDDAEAAAAGYVYDPSNPNLWTGVTPACWEYEMYTSASLNQIGDQLDTMPQVYRGFNSTEGGHYSLRMMNRCVYAMPEFDEEYPIENLTMTLKLRQPNSLYRLQVGVVDEQGVFTVVKTLKGGTTIETKTVSFANCPVSGRIAFRNTLVPGTGMRTDYLEYSYNYIDDINFVIGEEAKAEVSIAEAMESELDIEVYPNPTKDVVNVECTMNNVQCSGIEIVDVYGKIITTVDQTATQINVSGLAAGMYFVRVTTDRGVVTKPFVKK